MRRELSLNEIVLQGPIVAIKKNDVATNIILKVRRSNFPETAEKLKDEPLYNWPVIAFYGEVKDAIFDKYKTGDEVKIKGHISVSKKMVREQNIEYYDQKIVGENIDYAKDTSNQEFDLKKTKDECAQFCKFALRGDVSWVNSTPNTVTFSVRTYSKGVQNISVTVYTRKPESYLSQIKLNDPVEVIGTVQTLRKETTDGRMINRRNFIVSDIQVLDDKE